MVFGVMGIAVALRAAITLIAGIAAELMVRTYAILVRSVHYPAAASTL